MTVSIQPKVTLVGAGPGSSDLITLRGFKALQQASVVLYDALISNQLLNEIDDSVPKIYVGKRCSEHSYTQDDINKLIVENAYTYGHVVRLKGGDPFVFGRASEEIEYVESFGIPITVIPGVTSAVAVPASQGIPVTRRGISSSFWVMTATKKDGSFSDDLQLAAQSSATMVILMGIRKFSEIAQEVSKYRNTLTPFAIIQNGTLTAETCVTGMLQNYTSVLNTIDITKPGVIVIGDVVAEHPSFYEEEVQRVLNSNL
ncbi:uroporphyrinogen-III C-methyltransferase [Cellulophaga baltica]|uniref:uroporphyrinogen-III C-methyltransferase n=1 Tax=Cellulophaga TaxID=104264 RepID=UPI001C0679F3|nr:MULTISPECIES: uroporphyrinogen-III C-methyltransferase [Cellulophaga]MBU2995839.1 uroporphyrinogen-III C-methyltransferase [Cellulophaga baltica]MDO6767234.1 uroporphyrinogen-III C-methyltransferase [Cellulophaga sp. 1_MG-2023]